MAINLELWQYAGLSREPGHRMPVPEEPASVITNLVAEGATALTAGAELFTVRNRPGGDSIYLKVQLASSSDTASAANGRLLTAGQEYSFGLPDGASASLYEIDVRTI